jgi:copper chaperone CopZ
MQIKIYVPDIECDSCVKRISKKFNKESAIHSFHFNNDSVTVNFDKHKISTKQIIKIIKSLKFRASTQPFERKSFTERFRHIKNNKHKYKTELKVFSYALRLLVILFGLEFILYFIVLKNIPNFLANYGWWIFYLNISVATLTMAIWHVYSYRYKMTCMLGMMIGMTVGMQTGMMIGGVLGATNGFFMGALVGMLLATFVGALTGKGCGIMGVSEGMMAGIMGGTMGAMITVMMFSDHILIFMPFYMILNIIILWSMSYMLYEEVVEDNEHTKPRDVSFSTTAAIATIVNFVLLAIILYGPKSAFIAF